MTEGKDKVPGNTGPIEDTAAGKRPRATLDLKAVEVKPAGAEKSAGSDSGGKPAATGPSQPAKGEAKKAASPEPAVGSSQSSPVSAGVQNVQKRSAGAAAVVTHLIAGLLGGAAAYFGLQSGAIKDYLPLPPTQVEQTVQSLSQRLQALESAAKGADPAAGLARELAQAQTRLQALETAIAELPALKARESTLAAKTVAIEQSLAAITSDGGFSARVAALEEQLEMLARAAGTAEGQSGVADLVVITGKIAALEKQIEGQAAVIEATGSELKSDAQRAAQSLSEVKADIARLDQSIETVKADGARVDRTVQALREETARVASDVKELRAVIDQQAQSFVKSADIAAVVSPVAGQISEIEGSLNDVLRKEQERQANAERILVALELASLKRVIDRGSAFADELAAVRDIAGDTLDLAALEPFQATGVPTLVQLQNEGRAVLRAALDEGRLQEATTVWERLMAGAQSIVQIRKLNPEPGDTGADRLIANISQALSDGRLADVLQQIEKLPATMASPLAAWRDAVRARHTVDEAILATEQQLKTALVPAVDRSNAPSEPQTGGPAQ